MTTPHGDPGNVGSDPEEPPGQTPRPATRTTTAIERLLAWSLLLVLIPVVFLVAAGLGAFVYAAVVFVHTLQAIVRHPFPVGHHLGLFLLDIDLFLIGATLLISAVGFYELFVRRIDADESSPLPTWLRMGDLNDLKRRILAMIVLVLAVSFVEVVVDAPSGRDVVELGAGIAAVILAVTVFLRFEGHGSEGR